MTSFTQKLYLLTLAVVTFALCNLNKTTASQELDKHILASMLSLSPPYFSIGLLRSRLVVIVMPHHFPGPEANWTEAVVFDLPLEALDSDQLKLNLFGATKLSSKWPALAAFLESVVPESTKTYKLVTLADHHFDYLYFVGFCPKEELCPQGRYHSQLFNLATDQLVATRSPHKSPFEWQCKAAIFASSDPSKVYCLLVDSDGIWDENFRPTATIIPVTFIDDQNLPATNLTESVNAQYAFGERLYLCFDGFDGLTLQSTRCSSSVPGTITAGFLDQQSRLYLFGADLVVYISEPGFNQKDLVDPLKLTPISLADFFIASRPSSATKKKKIIKPRLLVFWCASIITTIVVMILVVVMIVMMRKNHDPGSIEPKIQASRGHSARKVVVRNAPKVNLPGSSTRVIAEEC